MAFLVRVQIHWTYISDANQKLSTHIGNFMSIKKAKRHGAHRSSIVRPRTRRGTAPTHREETDLRYQRYLDRQASVGTTPVITHTVSVQDGAPGVTYISRPSQR